MGDGTFASVSNRDQRKDPVVAIDGPAGSGKSTVAMMVAKELGYRLVDTGALYRSLALLAERKGVALEDAEGLGEIASGMDIQLKEEEGKQRVFLGQEDVTSKIRTPGISQNASKVSVHKQVREVLLHVQRELGNRGGVVMEGRDIGTVVFPDAEIKVFLKASQEVRAKRRFEELKKNAIEVSWEETLKEVVFRDERDEKRALAPLVPAKDATLIDTESLGAKEVAEKIVSLVRLKKSS